MSSPDGEGPLLLLDGMSLAFRAYFALPTTLATPQGVVTNALHGFLSMLLTLVVDHAPSAVAVAYDLPGGTFRDDLVDDYKGGRDEPPDDLSPQFDMIRQAVEVLGIPVVSKPGYEADDVIATLATEAAGRGQSVIVVTGDRDSFQLVADPFVRVLYNKRGVREYDLYDEAGIEARTGVRPVLYPQLASLRGDPSDNLPGVPGVGEKTAAKLLNQYGDLDGIYAHLGELTPKLRENLTEYEGRARSNLVVIPLVRDLDLGVSAVDLALGGWNAAAAAELFGRYDLKGTWTRVSGLLDSGALGPAGEGSAAPEDVVSVSSSPWWPKKVVAGGPSLTAALAAMAKAQAKGEILGIGVAWEGDPGRSPVGALGFVRPGHGVGVDGEAFGDPGVRQAAIGLLRGACSGHDVKELERVLLAAGEEVGGGLVMETGIAGYLLDSSGRFDQEAVCGRLGLEPIGVDVEGAPKGVDAALTEAATAGMLREPLEAALTETGLSGILGEIEIPLVGVLARMEALGIGVDRGGLEEIATDLATQATALERAIVAAAGYELNVNSTPQLRKLLYEDLGLQPGRKTKTGYSTDAATLEGLRGAHPVVDALLEYREVEKLRSTYGENLLGEIGEDGRIHASFRQTVARTGRLSSDRPNLHNIPTRRELGRRFRTVFVPSKGKRFLVADYDQVELRVIAHLSGDPGLMAAFEAGTDIHRTIAAGVYGVPPEDVTHEQRDRAKAVSYGLAYGMEAYGLSRRIGTTVEESSEIIARYFGAYPEVERYMSLAVEEARECGYTRTAMGRIRRFPDLTSPNRVARQAAERAAMNAGIQGLAADIFKIALIRLDGALAGGGYEARLVLQVHDEVIVEAPVAEEKAGEVERICGEALTGAAELSVPLLVSMHWGATWGSAKAG